MKKFRQFLISEGASQTNQDEVYKRYNRYSEDMLSDDHFLKTQIDPHKDVLKLWLKSPPIFRGLRHRRDGEFYIVDLTGVNRHSANTNNFFTMMVSEILPSWSLFPKRSESLICSGNRSTASGYGVTYRVLPLEEDHLAIANSEDFWDITRESSGPFNMWDISGTQYFGIHARCNK